MTFHIITIFPNMFDSYLAESILARAIKERKIKVKFYNPRDFVRGKLRKVWPDGNISSKIDDRPYGGGPGMVMIADPIISAWESAMKSLRKPSANYKTVIFSPSGGKKLDTAFAKNSAKKYTDVIMICGRYEGIDARVKKITKAARSVCGRLCANRRRNPSDDCDRYCFKTNRRSVRKDRITRGITEYRVLKCIHAQKYMNTQARNTKSQRFF
jgi:tRNA (guanine-N1)-methyltransferase